MRFTIVTVAFNQAQFVESALRSVIDQNYPDLEYIVVDPGSTDGTRDIIEHYRGVISKILFRSDSGPAEGLNNGFAASTGDILGFLNSDDILLPGTLARVAAEFSASTELDVVSGHMWIIDKHGVRTRKSFTDSWNKRAFAYGACVTCQQATFFRRQIFLDAGGFNNANRISWDSELFLEIFQRRNRHKVVNQLLAGFRIHDESITGSNRRQGLKREFFERRFARIMGRPWRASDRAVRYLFLALKYLRQPRSLYQRLRYGPISRT